MEGGKVYVGGMANGAEKIETNWTDASSSVQTAHPIVGTYTVATCVFASTPSAGQYEALKNKKAVFDLVPEGNVVFVGNDGQTPVTPKLTVNFKEADGTIENFDISNGTFAIRTNNKDELEYVKTSGVLAAKGQPIDPATGSPSTGTKGYDATTFEVKNYDGDSWESLSPKVYLHEADKVGVSSVAVDLSARA